MVDRTKSHDDTLEGNVVIKADFLTSEGRFGQRINRRRYTLSNFVRPVRNGSSFSVTFLIFIPAHTDA